MTSARLSGEACAWIDPDRRRALFRHAAAAGIDFGRIAEGAAIATCEVARERLGGSLGGRHIFVLVGPGRNGAVGLAAARRLAGAGADVAILLGAPVTRISAETAAQLRICERAELRILSGHPEYTRAELYVDALLAGGSVGRPRDGLAKLIELTASRRTIALDLPSGLDPVSGAAASPVISAEATLAIGPPLRVLADPRLDPIRGELYICDLGIPATIAAAVGYEPAPPGVSPFAAAALIRVG